jgi:uncharacterized membrane protein
MDSIEYLHDGDVASVAMQYSYLHSPLALLVQPGYGAESARALFSQVYGHWRSLPRDTRPKLYLHGLSLGAMNSERSTELFEILEDPIDGALWSGPPFESTIWRRVTEAATPAPRRGCRSSGTETHRHKVSAADRARSRRAASVAR